MAIATMCPRCEARYSLRDSLRDKKVRCKKCGENFEVVETVLDAQDGMGAVQNQPSPPRIAPLEPALARRRPENFGFEDEDRFRSRSSGSHTGLIIGLSMGAGVLLLAIIGVAVWAFLPSEAEPEPPPKPAPVAQKPIWNPQHFPPVDKKPIRNPQDFPPLAEKPIRNPQDFPPLPRQDDPIPAKADPITLAVSKLQSGDGSNQSDAAKWLEKAKVDDKRRAEVLVALKAIIDNHRPGVPRCDALKALATWATRADTPYLIGLLDDNDNGVKQETLWALAKLKDPAAVEAIVAVFPHHRNEAREALLAIGPGAEAAVRTLLDSPDDGIRIDACKILKTIGTAASHQTLIQLAEREEGGVAEAARDALPAKLRPPVWGAQLTIRVCVVNGGRFPQLWPAVEAKFKALADSPRPKCKVNTSGECKWVELAPVKSDAETFSRKINFGKVTAVHNNQRLIYIELR
jgi:predicted Zn finger-like uncharacterized protein